MKRAKALINSTLAGTLMEDNEGYGFRYDSDYLTSNNAKAVSLTSVDYSFKGGSLKREGAAAVMIAASHCARKRGRTGCGFHINYCLCTRSCARDI